MWWWCLINLDLASPLLQVRLWHLHCLEKKKYTNLNRQGHASRGINYERVYTHTHTHMHSRTHSHTHTCAHTHMSAHTHTHTQTLINIDTINQGSKPHPPGSHMLAISLSVDMYWLRWHALPEGSCAAQMRGHDESRRVQGSGGYLHLIAPAR